MTREEVGAFIAGFEACQLSKQQWTHQAHLTAGFWYVTQLGVREALPVIRGNIRRHNESVGTPNTDTGGYHESITRLYLMAIDRHIRTYRDVSFEVSLQALLASELGNSTWPLTYYSSDRLFSVDARRSWVEPDLQIMEQPGI